MKTRQVEDIYELTPLQQGILFHTIKEPESDLYLEQFCYVCSGSADSRLLQEAWQCVLDRHAILRTSFYWQDLEKPLQVVQQQVDLPWQQLDWRGVDPAEQQARLASLLQADRELRFDLSEAPLMRLTFIQTSQDEAYLLWSFHHLLLDGWSTALVLQEVIATYSAFYAGQYYTPPPERPFRDYLLWLQQDEREAKQFWQQQLKGFTMPTPLPGALQEQPAGVQVEQEMRLSQEVTTALHTFARTHRLTLNTLMQGAWALLLSQQSGEKDIVFGTTVSGRPAELTGVESMIGLFINTLPMRAQIRPYERLHNWLAELQKHQISTREYEYCSLVQIQGWSEVPREKALFESILVFESYPSAPAKEQAALTLRTHSLYEKAHYPLGLMVLPGEQIRLRIRYDSAVFEHTMIKRIQDQLQCILETMVRSATQQLWQVMQLTPADKEHLAAWKPTPFADPRTLPALLRVQAEHTPDAIALSYQGEQLSYQALFHHAEALAHRLQVHNIGPDSLVGLCCERGPQHLIALLAIVLSGAAFLPLDTQLPEQRLRFLLTDAQPELLLADASHAARLRELTTLPLLALQEPTAEPASTSPLKADVQEPHPLQLAYVIYTSGSTGIPKGVQITHRGLAHLVAAQCPLFSIQQESRVLQFATHSFDASVSEIFTTLAAGACLVLAPRDQLLPGPDLQHLLAEQAVSVVTLPPTALQLVESEMLPALQTVVSAGEACPRELVEGWRGQGRFLNAYGPTEVTVCATAGVVPTGQPLSAVPSIGRPLAHCPVYVLDEQMQPVPIGVVGELYVGGEALARGYRGQAGWTAERFVPDPFSGQPGARLYRTGDRARWRTTGDLEYVGRRDRQVKLRGYRIELEEIEEVLRSHEQVEDCAVVVRQEEQGERWLVGYVVRKTGTGAGVYEWRAWLRERLPSYQVPARIVELEALPLLPSGKHNLHALPAPGSVQQASVSPAAEPQSTLEQAIAAIWCEVLHVEKIGLYDNFFDLGGHSIAALKVYGKLHPRFKDQLKMTDLFTYPTISTLAKHLTRTEEPRKAESAREEQIKAGRTRIQSRLKTREALLTQRAKI